MDENVRGAMREVQFFSVLSGAGGGSEPEKTSWMDGGALRAPNGAGAEKLAARLLSMSYAFISLNPGLWSPLTVETKEEESRCVLSLTKRANGVFHAGMDRLRDIELLHNVGNGTRTAACGSPALGDLSSATCASDHPLKFALL